MPACNGLTGQVFCMRQAAYSVPSRLGCQASDTNVIILQVQVHNVDCWNLRTVSWHLSNLCLLAMWDKFVLGNICLHNRDDVASKSRMSKSFRSDTMNSFLYPLVSTWAQLPFVLVTLFFPVLSNLPVSVLPDRFS